MLAGSSDRRCRTLATVTETLCSEVARPTALVPRWSESEWRIARAAAALHGISALLSHRLPWRGPSSWMHFLDAQRVHTRRRQERIADAVSLIDDHARRSGVALIALKGAALYARGIYENGERPMADIDLLAQPADALAVRTLLSALGYVASGSTWKHEIFQPREATLRRVVGEHSDNHLKIELHYRIVDHLPVTEIDISGSIMSDGLPPGVTYYRSMGSLMMHLLFHAAGAMVSRALRFVQVHDLALLAQRMTTTDWAGLVAERSDDSGLWWAAPPPLRLERYDGAVIPSFVMEAVEEGCPRTLRLGARCTPISNVSFSYPWIDPLPGLGWTRTWLESIQYVTSRLAPPGWRRSELEYTAGNSGVDGWQRLVPTVARAPCGALDHRTSLPAADDACFGHGVQRKRGLRVSATRTGDGRHGLHWVRSV